ncbi:glycosyltransferase [Lewinella sp. LCG006]|uniref:glycosyltransferase n=1 Tax=Lewinella sp. LCG006 TaxID=3231911 RepID=UPI003460E5DA
MANTEHRLIAILDWGLGHASRCVPLVKAWQKKGARVTVASAGSALLLLKASLEGVDFVELPAYAVRYPTRSMSWNLGIQSPRLLGVMRKEHQILGKYAQQEKVDLIVSDGRFGCWSKRVKSIWLAHQLQIQHRRSWLAWMLNKGYHAFVRQHFAEVWVPDLEGEESLAGDLAQPITGLPHRYLGPLSRFADKPLEATNKMPYQWLALLSGPEPQRSYLEEELITCLKALDVPALLVRGVPGSTQPTSITAKLSIVDWLLGDQLAATIAQAEQLVCRSGYSTLLDAYHWQKPLLLVPTPGQTEQEYLARYWASRGWAELQKQGEVSL